MCYLLFGPLRLRSVVAPHADCCLQATRAAEAAEAARFTTATEAYGTVLLARYVPLYETLNQVQPHDRMHCLLLLPSLLPA